MNIYGGLAAQGLLSSMLSGQSGWSTSTGASSLTLALPEIAAPVPASVTRAKARFTTAGSIAPWAAGEKARPDALRLLGQSIGEVTTVPATSTVLAELADIHATWTRLDRMGALAKLAEGTVSAGQRAAAGARFEALLGAIRTDLLSAPTGPAEIFAGAAATSARSAAVRVPPAAFKGSAPVASRSADLGLAADARMVVELGNALGQDRVDVSLAGAGTLDEVAARINAAIAAAPRLHGARVAVEWSAAGWHLTVRGNSDDVTLLEPAAPVEALLASPGPGGSLALISPSGVRRVVGPIRDAAGEELAITVAQLAGGPAGTLFVRGTVSRDGSEEQVLVRVDSTGKAVWQEALGDAAARLEVDGRGVVSVTGTSVSRFDEGGRRTLEVEAPPGTTITGATLDPRVDGAVVVATTDTDGRTQIMRLDRTGAVIDRRELAAGTRVSHLAATVEGFVGVLAHGDGTASVMTLGAEHLAPGASASLGAGRVRATAWHDGRLHLLHGTPAGDKKVMALDTTGDLSVASSFAVDPSADAIASTTRGILVTGSTETVGTSEIRDTSGALVHRHEQALPGGGARLLAAGLAGAGGTLAKLGLRPGAVADGDGAVELAALGTAPEVGDSFTIDAGDRRIEVRMRAGDTLQTLARRITTQLGQLGKATVVTDDGGTYLRIDSRLPDGFALRAGPTGHDLLGALGMGEQRIAAVRVRAADDPAITPGGTYALKLDALRGLGSREAAKATASVTAAAQAQLRSAYRSLYWDEAKELIAAGTTSVSAAQTARIKNYQEALARLGG